MLCSSRALLIAALALGAGVQWLSPPAVHAPAPASLVTPSPCAGAPLEPQRRKKKTSGEVKFEPFVGGLTEAKKASREQNVPLLVHVILEDEPQNDEYRDKLLPREDLIALSRKAVVIVANNGDHPPRKVTETVEGEKTTREVCSKYPWFDTCSQHREAWPDVYADFQDENGELSCPQTIILLPDGAIAWHNHDANPPEIGELLTALKNAQDKAGPGLARDELARVKTLRAEARRSTDGKLWGDAWRAWSEVQEIAEAGVFADEAKAALPPLEKEMRAALEALLPGLVPGKAAATYAALDELARDYAETPVEGEVRKAMKRAEKDKELGDEIEAWKLEREAEALRAEADELFKKGEERDATKILRKLLRKKYAGTKVAERVREEFPELAGDG